MLNRAAIAPVNDALLADFELMEQYASAAYCWTNFNSPGNQIKCNDGTCPLVQAANATSVVEYNRSFLRSYSDLATDVTGFVALDPTNELIVVSFRGSVSIQNWITNIDFKAVSTNLCSGCTAHRGFYQSWLDSRSAVTATVNSLVAANPRYKVITTGHSLGGAIATLAAADLRNSGYPVALYSFGSPRVSSSKLANYITAQPGGNYRITHWNDPVPNIPPILMNFAHVSPEYYINRPNHQVVKATDFKIYEGATNMKGNAAWLFTDILAHLWYFGSFPMKCQI
ncbi:alpha/beta-hydrolase [Bimuria novae-zelandiae CBS 107.79]|uniref:Alpha/beta-hydrolase n=1 Tax=Bimuria novae-zelandiae CBS 107.79 TaxID=1447943 RepID=A0A6A5VM18_9PLEO|nr:alpha/beta-hydrolase [Bimuria novae-zelandiae CBS 107.79]